MPSSIKVLPSAITAEKQTTDNNSINKSLKNSSEIVANSIDLIPSPPTNHITIKNPLNSNKLSILPSHSENVRKHITIDKMNESNNGLRRTLLGRLCSFHHTNFAIDDKSENQKTECTENCNGTDTNQLKQLPDYEHVQNSSNQIISECETNWDQLIEFTNKKSIKRTSSLDYYV